MRNCTKCHNFLSETNFSLRKRKDGKSYLHSWCKTCVSNYRTTYRNRPGYRQYMKDVYSSNRIAWKDYFKKIYGNNPYCSICQKQLTFDYVNQIDSFKKRNQLVYFDHRHGDKGDIRCSPSEWYARNLCSSENKEIWNKQDFGILCLVCNQALPTINRQEWIDRLLTYTRESNDKLKA